MHCNEVRRGTAMRRRRCRHRLPRRCFLRCGAGPCMARRRLLHGGAAIRTFFLGNHGRTTECASIRRILLRSLNDYKTSLFSYANSYTLSLKLTQRFPPSGLRPKSDKFRQGVHRESLKNKMGGDQSSTTNCSPTTEPVRSPTMSPQRKKCWRTKLSK